MTFEAFFEAIVGVFSLKGVCFLGTGIMFSLIAFVIAYFLFSGCETTASLYLKIIVCFVADTSILLLFGGAEALSLLIGWGLGVLLSDFVEDLLIDAEWKWLAKKSKEGLFKI